MTFDQFHNGLRVLLNIDGGDFLRAVYGPNHSIGDVAEVQNRDWCDFRDNPHEWFIRAPDAKAQAIWKIVAERTKGAEA